MKYYLAIALVVFSYTTFAQGKQIQLVPYRKGNLWGYCDMNKKIRIPIKFEEAYSFGYLSDCCFYEDHALVKFHGELYVINRKGRIEKENTFLAKEENIEPPIQELEMSTSDIYEKDGSVTFNGKVIVPANKYKTVKLLGDYNPFFIVTDSNSLSGVIDRNQKLILPLKYHNIFYFILKDYYDSNAHKYVNPVYFVFKEPKAKKQILVKYLDTIIKQVTVHHYKELKNYIAFGEPKSAFKNDQNWGILDRNLNVIVKPKFAEISKEESNDIFLVLIYNYNKKGQRLENKIGYINKKGTEFFEH